MNSGESFGTERVESFFPFGADIGAVPVVPGAPDEQGDDGLVVRGAEDAVPVIEQDGELMKENVASQQRELGAGGQPRLVAQDIQKLEADGLAATFFGGRMSR